MASLRRFTILAVTLLMLGTFLFVPMETKAVKAATRGTLLVFLPGFNTDSSTPFEFSAIRSVLLAKYPNVAAFSYSYTGLNHTYSKFDTVVHSLSNDVAALTTYLTTTSIKNRDVYLIGHSLGGVIATKYASTFSGFPSTSNARLAGVITLDSPVNGVDPNAQGATCYSLWLNILIAIAGRQNVPILGELTPGNATVGGIQKAGNKIPILSIGSKNDCFIPPSDTYIKTGENALVTSGGTGVATHGTVLKDPNAIDIINHWNEHDNGVSHLPRPVLTTDCGNLTTPWIALYQYANYGGRQLCFEGTGTMNLADFEFANQTTSINVAAIGSLFDGPNGCCNQLPFYYGDQQSDLGTFDNRVVSFVVTS